MTNTFLIYPMFALVLVTVCVLVVMFRRRVVAIRNGQVKLEHFKTYNSGASTDEMIKAERHFSNLFEVPVLFYVGCLVAMNIPLVGFWILLWPWLFVVARVVHAIIHLGSNKIYWRMRAYGLGWIAVLALWIHIVYVVATSSLIAI